MENSPEENKKPMSLEEARMRILVLRDQISAMGNNDYEIPKVNEIIAKLDAGEIITDEAIGKAVDEVEQILANKVEAM